MYKKVSTDMNFVEREKEVEKFWADNDIFRKSMKEREGSPMYTFYGSRSIRLAWNSLRQSEKKLIIRGLSLKRDFPRKYAFMAWGIF